MSDLTDDQLREKAALEDDCDHIKTMATELLAARARLREMEEALQQFADPKNWVDKPANLQWAGKRHAIDFAAAAIRARSCIP